MSQNLVKRTIKRLTCKHDYELYTNFSYHEIDTDKRYHEITVRCSKCGKRSGFPHFLRRITHRLINGGII